MQVWNHSSSPVRAYLEVKVFEKVRRGYRRVLFRHRQPVRSFVLNWTKAIYGLMYERANSQAVQLVNTSGESVWYPDIYDASSEILKVRAPEGNTYFGILFGSGTTAPTLDDYKLESLIPHGTGSGQLYYHATQLSYEKDTDRARVIVWRTADNNSGGDITISELGLVMIWYPSPAEYALILRDVLDTAVVVANTQSVEGRYVFEFVL